MRIDLFKLGSSKQYFRNVMTKNVASVSPSMSVEVQVLSDHSIPIF